MKEVNIYLETSMKGPGTRIGWHAAVVEYEKKNGDMETREDFGQEETTYHKSVLTALIKALKRLNVECSVTVYTDCQLIKTSFENHLPKWKENGFLNIKGEPIKNQEEWKELAAVAEKHEMDFVITKKHYYSSWMRTEAENRFPKNLEKSE